MSLFEPIFAALENGAVRYVAMREVDLFVENPIDFDLLYERSQIVPLATTNVRIASIEDLIQLKRLANRPEDQRDIEALQAIRRSKRDG
jgi:hypothetical protein